MGLFQFPFDVEMLLHLSLYRILYLSNLLGSFNGFHLNCYILYMDTVYVSCRHLISVRFLFVLFPCSRCQLKATRKGIVWFLFYISFPLWYKFIHMYVTLSRPNQAPIRNCSRSKSNTQNAVFPYFFISHYYIIIFDISNTISNPQLRCD